MTVSRADAPPVEVRGLVQRYGELVAVAGVDLTVLPGDVFGYLGPNGAGKTTSLRMLMGLIRPTEGRITVFGHEIRPGAPVRLVVHKDLVLDPVGGR